MPTHVHMLNPSCGAQAKTHSPSPHRGLRSLAPLETYPGALRTALAAPAARAAAPEPNESWPHVLRI